MNARRDGWHTVYVAAEMDESEYLTRAGRRHGMSYEQAYAARDQIIPQYLIQFEFGQSLDTVVDILSTTVNEDTDRICLVLDSITKIALYSKENSEGGSGGDDIFRKLELLTAFVENLVRISGRRVMVVATSELSKEGAAFGRRLTYAANLQINMMESKRSKELVDIQIAKGRNSAKTGPMEDYMQNWEQHLIEKVGVSQGEEGKDGFFYGE